jgi:hypothetical protein
VLLATLLAQAAWILAVPPFRGMDEFDHAFRASGVASGQWRLDDQAAGGRGLLVDVPDDLLAASQGQCESLAYIVPETCAGDGPGAEPGTVRATTSAANYEPVFYWVVGTAGEPFTGADSLYAMRAMAALMCAIVLALAAWCMTTWVRGWWAFVGLFVGLTPTLIYSTTIPAPNGLEMAAGVCLWAALLGLGGRDATALPRAALVRRERWLLAAATLSVVLLAGLRALGPLWVVLILACVMALRGPRSMLDVARRHRGQVALAATLAVTVSVAVLLWNRGNVPISPGAKNHDIDASWGQVVRWPNWILGSIGAFPYRDQPAPLMVHLLVLLVMVAMLVVAVRRAHHGRAAVVLATTLCFVVPSVLVAISLQGRGGMWQGRYDLPFTAGVMLLTGLVLDRVRWRSGGRDIRLPGLAVLMLAVAQVVSVVHVQLAELGRDVSAEDAGWIHPPAAGTALLMALAWVVLGAVALSQRPNGAAETDPAPSLTGAAPEARAR